MKALIDALLKDENGISEEAYMALLDYLARQKAVMFPPQPSPVDRIREATELYDYVKSADATDGRFYFSE